MSEKKAEYSIMANVAELQTTNETYTVGDLICRGTYNSVYSIVRNSDGRKLCMKVESAKTARRLLRMDWHVLTSVQSTKSKHFCIAHDCAEIPEKFSFVVMQLIGKTLSDLQAETDSKSFTIGTSLKAALQCLVGIEELHRINYLHRDINPSNFAVGLEALKEHHLIYMFDFVLCRSFRNKSKGLNKPRDSAPFHGTLRYASLSAMKEQEQSRKDDIEGWLYMVVEWTAGTLPWMRLNTDSRAEMIQMKAALRSDDKALDRFLVNCPKREFSVILNHLDELTYAAVPDYQSIYKCVEHALKANGIQWSDPLDWDMETNYMMPKEEPGEGVALMEKNE